MATCYGGIGDTSMENPETHDMDPHTTPKAMASWKSFINI